MSVRIQIIIDLLFYLGLPLVIWHYGRAALGDYQAMFLSAFTMIAYTGLKFFREKKYNITGLFLVFGITVYLLLNILSESAIGILYNSLYLNGILLVIYTLSIIIRRPLGKYFYVDYRRMYGEEQRRSLEHIAHFDKKIYFDYLTALLSARELVLLVVKWILLSRMGIEGASFVIFVNRILSYVFVGLIALMTVKINSKWTLTDNQERGDSGD